MGVLNLANADLKGFDALPAGTYDCTVFEVTMKETQGGADSKLPKGTPYFNVQYRVADGEYENRRLFNKYFIVPAKIDGKVNEKKNKSDGMLARWLIAIGYTEAEVTADGFDPDLEDMAGRPCRVVIKQKPNYNDKTTMDNEVVGVKPPGVDEGSGLL